MGGCDCSRGRAKDECRNEFGNKFGIMDGYAGRKLGKQSSDASSFTIDSGAVSGDDPSAAEAAKAMAGDAGGDKNR
jgi:hypothetical protein